MKVLTEDITLVKELVLREGQGIDRKLSSVTDHRDTLKHSVR